MEENKRNDITVSEASDRLTQSLDDLEQNAMNNTDEDGNTESAKQKLQPVTVRFTAATWEAIRTIAEDTNVSMAELVRYAVTRNLDEYLGTIQYADEGQARMIRDTILQIFTVMSDIKMELTRIGIDYDKQAVLSRIDRELAKPGLSLEREKELFRKRREVLDDVGVLDSEQMDSLMARYDAGVREVGEPLWRILVSLPRATE